MKRAFIIFAAVAAMVASAGCEKKEKDSETHEIVVTVNSSVTGAFTKAITINAEITDFDGNVTSAKINDKFDGENASFEKSFSAKSSDLTKTAKISFNAATKNDVNSYMSEPAPWSAGCVITVTVDGNEVDNYEVAETESNTAMTIVDNVLMNNWAREYVNYLNNSFGSKAYTISIDSEGYTIEIK